MIARNLFWAKRMCAWQSEFDIARRVSQGDVIGSVLFNAITELVFKQWKLRLSHHGWLLTLGSERFTNIRYADDILLYAKSLDELEEILGLLDDELASVGLELHEGKTKIITSDSSNSISFVEISSKLIEMFGPQKSHKYIGKYLMADASRNQVELQYRIRIAWHDFHKHIRWLLNRNIPVQLRLHLICV